MLITQLYNGEVFDFGFIIEKKGVEYFIGGQIALNKTKDEIKKYISKIQNKENKILDNIKALTGRDIKELRFIIIFNKEWQDELFKEYSKLYSKVNKQISKRQDLNSKNSKKTKLNTKVKNIKKKTAFEQNIENSGIDKLNHFNSRYGIQCCKNENISYIFFSNIDFKFYDHENVEIEYFNVDNLHPIKKGFEKFIFNEYNLMPVDSKNIILTKNEIKLLLNKIKEVKEDINNIEIKYKLKETVPLLSGTPYNSGILSITKDIKVFTYYEDVFSHYLLKKNKISLYPQSGELFDDNYSKEHILVQYFVKLISKNDSIPLDEDEDNKKSENTNKKSFKKKEKIENDEKENYLNNNLKYLQKRDID